MIITGFGIKLVRLQHADIEMVRQHRNSPEIAQYMEYRKEITPGEQEKWFRSIDNEFNNYFLIYQADKPIGLIYGHTDWNRKETMNGGIFIWDKTFIESAVPLAASLMLTEMSFRMGLERIYAKILRDNERAISFNKSLGFEILPGQEKIYNQQYVLTRDNFFARTGKLKTLFTKTHGDIIRIMITDPEHPSSKIFREIISSLKPEKIVLSPES
jgi:UDP-4-amino-4,6-dideoxy-N-acetyl-beta-L-altrosamine N-acetyltransferase